MCIVCQWNSGEEKIDSNIGMLSCGNCTSFTSIPVLPKLQYLSCGNCTSLTSIPVLPKLQYLSCRGCTALTSIPILPELEELYCERCTSLTRIHVFPKLSILNCWGCTAITAVHAMPKLKELDCKFCRSLTSITELPQLEYLYCENCTALTSIPSNVSTFLVFFFNGCKWLNIKGNRDFENNMRSLRSCQAIFKRKLTARKLEKLLPELIAIYYAPGCKGEHIASRAFLALRTFSDLANKNKLY